MTKTNYRVAVVIYNEGDEHLVFQDTPECMVRVDEPCFVPADIEAAAGQASRQMAREMADAKINSQDYAPIEL